MSRFANEFTMNEIVSQPAREIPWYTLVEITHKSQTHKEMLWYINNIKTEKELQNSLLQNISKFILELGNGFSFVSYAKISNWN